MSKQIENSVEIVDERSKHTWGIGELASEFGITSRTLRVYEEEGLLDPERDGTRRIYNERNRVRLRLILRGKRLGWSLSEIRESFDLYDSSLGEQAQLELMMNKLDQRRETLIAQRDDIDSALRDLEQVVSNARQSLRDIRTAKGKRPVATRSTGARQ
jgi:DNA-binding transcriptional MerR regulator